MKIVALHGWFYKKTFNVQLYPLKEQVKKDEYQITRFASNKEPNEISIIFDKENKIATSIASFELLKLFATLMELPIK